MGTDYDVDVKGVVTGAFPWVAYAGTLLVTHDKELADNAKDAVADISGTVSLPEKNSISKRTAELCKSAWKEVLKNYDASEFKDLPDYNFARDPFHWDDLQTIEKHIEDSRRKNKINVYPVSPNTLAREVILELGSRMDDDLNLKVLINQEQVFAQLENISKRLGDGIDSTYVTVISDEGNFSLDHLFGFFGREIEIEEILAALETNKIVIIHGEGGIGKTELCREIIQRSGKKVVPVNLVDCRTYWDFISRIAGVLGIGINPDTTEAQLARSILDQLNSTEETILYLDNFEDVISEKKTNQKDRNNVYAFLRNCDSLRKLRILISSREIPEGGIPFWPKGLHELDDDSAVKLFNSQWQGKKTSEEDIRKFVVSELHCYPLSIVLCANQWRYTSSLNVLKEKWQNAKVSVSNMENERHTSIQTALRVTYEEIKDMKSARKLWELFTLFPDMIDEQVAETVIDEYDEAMRKLVNLTVLHRVDGGTDDYAILAIQPTLREYIASTELYQEDIAEITESLKKYYINLFNVDRNKERGSDIDRKAINSLQNVLYFMDYLRDKKEAEGFGKLHASVRDYYMEDPYAAIDVIEKAAEELDFEEDKYTKANLNEYCGDLEMRTDKLTEAEGHYRETEELYRRIQDDLGLANVLKAQGDLEMRTDKLPEAEGHYREAEELYRRIHADLGLANVLKAQGDLERRTAKLPEAEGHYREAEELYRRIRYDLGVANVLQAQGDLERRTAKLPEAEGHYREAEELYHRIHADLGLANVLKAQGDLEMRTDKLPEAEGHYREAEELYRRIHEDLGLANVLKAQGDLERRTAKLTEAEDHYREAEKLYRRIRYDIGVANVRLAKGDLAMRTDKLAEAEGLYREAEELYRRIREDLGLANVLKAQGDLEMRTDKLTEAEGHYREAEELYRRIREDLGLANVLKAQGDLARRMAKLTEAEDHYREAENLYRRIQYDLGVANVRLAQGDLAMRTAKLTEAEGRYREAEELYRCIHSDLGVANVFQRVGDLLQKLRDYEEASQKYEAAILLYSKTQDTVGISFSYAKLCFCYAKLGDSDKVRDCVGKLTPLLDALPYDNVKAYCEHKTKEAREMLGVSI